MNPERAAAAFGLVGAVVPLPGGQGTSVRVADAVLKPAGSAEEAEWCARMLASLPPDPAFRVPRPLRTRSGAYVAEGWTATAFVYGEPDPASRQPEVLTVARAFHRALRGVPRPSFLDRHTHPWAVADRVAWGEADPPDGPPALITLLALRRPVAMASQLVHGDLAGNVLFSPREPPAVIDFSPYWRPPGYAEAIVIADGLLYHGLTDPAVSDRQLLVRALLFRLVTLILLGRDESDAFERVSGCL